MFNNKENSLKRIKVSCEQKEPFLRSKSFVTRNIINIKVGNDIETGSRKIFCRFRSENDLNIASDSVANITTSCETEIFNFLCLI